MASFASQPINFTTKGPSKLPFNFFPQSYKLAHSTKCIPNCILRIDKIIKYVSNRNKHSVWGRFSDQVHSRIICWDCSRSYLTMPPALTPTMAPARDTVVTIKKSETVDLMDYTESGITGRYNL